MFSCEFCESSKNTFFTEHLRWLLLFINKICKSEILKNRCASIFSFEGISMDLGENVHNFLRTLYNCNTSIINAETRLCECFLQQLVNWIPFCIPPHCSSLLLLYGNCKLFCDLILGEFLKLTNDVVKLKKSNVVKHWIICFNFFRGVIAISFQFEF